MAKSTATIATENEMRTIAILLYIMDYPYPKDYLILMLIKAIRRLMHNSYVHKEQIKAMFTMSNEDLDPILYRLQDNGWITINDSGYLDVVYYGDKELHRIMGAMSVTIDDIRKRKPIYQWAKSKRLSSL